MRARSIGYVRCFAGCLLAAALLVTAARGADKAQAPSLFSQVFAKPTGQNGYEEFVAAADLVARRERVVDAAVDGTLAQKRAALANRDCALALQLLRRGLRKPVQARESAVDWGVRAPELPQFRRLGRLLQVEQYVLFADGRTRQAIGSLFDALRFARAIHTELPRMALHTRVWRGR